MVIGKLTSNDYYVRWSSYTPCTRLLPPDSVFPTVEGRISEFWDRSQPNPLIVVGERSAYCGGFGDLFAFV
jgi:hypothetical protein